MYLTVIQSDDTYILFSPLVFRLSMIHWLNS